MNRHQPPPQPEIQKENIAPNQAPNHEFPGSPPGLRRASLSSAPFFPTPQKRRVDTPLKPAVLRGQNSYRLHHDQKPDRINPWKAARISLENQGVQPAVSGKNGDPNLFIFHLPNSWTEKDLLDHFSPFGQIISARIMKDKITNKTKGFGFVSFLSIVSAFGAIQTMNGFRVKGKKLKVELKKMRFEAECYFAPVFKGPRYG
jgi:hypothetical protein